MGIDGTSERLAGGTRRALHPGSEPCPSACSISLYNSHQNCQMYSISTTYATDASLYNVHVCEQVPQPGSFNSFGAVGPRIVTPVISAAPCGSSAYRREYGSSLGRLGCTHVFQVCIPDFFSLSGKNTSQVVKTDANLGRPGCTAVVLHILQISAIADMKQTCEQHQHIVLLLEVRLPNRSRIPTDCASRWIT